MDGVPQVVTSDLYDIEYAPAPPETKQYGMSGG